MVFKETVGVMIPFNVSRCRVDGRRPWEDDQNGLLGCGTLKAPATASARQFLSLLHPFFVPLFPSVLLNKSFQHSCLHRVDSTNRLFHSRGEQP